MSDNRLLHEKLISEVRKMRELQKRYWSSQQKNDLQAEYKRKLLIQSKMQEQVVDNFIVEISAEQISLGL